MNHAEVIAHVLKGMPKCTSIFIAGGAAVRADWASDIDVWFRMQDKARALKYLQTFQVYTYSNGESYDHEDDGGEIVGEAYDPTIMKVVQVLTYGHKNLHNLLKSFDISTHQKAILATGTVIEGEAFTPPTELPKIIGWKHKTFQRYIKICQRYGHPVDMGVLGQATPQKTTFTTQYKLWQQNYLYSPVADLKIKDIDGGKAYADYLPTAPSLVVDLETP